MKPKQNDVVYKPLTMLDQYNEVIEKLSNLPNNVSNLIS
jgi:hypothetical protein